MLDILLPETDGGAASQFLVLILITVLALVMTRHNRDLRILILGIAVLLAGLLAVRAIH